MVTSYASDVHRVWDYTIPSRPSQSIVKRGHDVLQVCFSCRSNHEQASRLQLIFPRRAPYGEYHQRAIVQGAEVVQHACAQIAAAMRPGADADDISAASSAAVTNLAASILKHSTHAAHIPPFIAASAATTAQSAAEKKDAPLAMSAAALAGSAVVMCRDPAVGGAAAEHAQLISDLAADALNAAILKQLLPL